MPLVGDDVLWHILVLTHCSCCRVETLEAIHRCLESDGMDWQGRVGTLNCDDLDAGQSGQMHPLIPLHQQCEESNIASLRCRWGSPVEKAAAMTSGSGVLGRGRPRPWSEWTNASGRCRCTSPGRSGFKSSPRTQEKQSAGDPLRNKGSRCRPSRLARR